MRFVSRTLVSACLCGLAVPALALGPVDGEVGAMWWAQDLESETGAGTASADGDAPGFRAELWMHERYGLRADQFQSEADVPGSASSDSTSVDVMWRAFSAAENTFVAVGLGWQMMDLESAGLDGDTSGARLAVEGRIGILGQLYAYGRGAYLPSMDDAAGSAGRFENVDGMQYEIGVSWRLAPFISMQAGYRADSLDFTHTEFAPVVTNDGRSNDGPPQMPLHLELSPNAIDEEAGIASSASGTTEAKGYFAGLSFHF